jgi:hypothetical protein
VADLGTIPIYGDPVNPLDFFIEYYTREQGGAGRPGEPNRGPDRTPSPDIGRQADPRGRCGPIVNGQCTFPDRPSDPITEVVVGAPRDPPRTEFIPPQPSEFSFLGTVVAAVPRRAPPPRRAPVRRTRPAPRTRPRRPVPRRLPPVRYTPVSPPKPSTIPLGARLLGSLGSALTAGVAALLYSAPAGPDDEYPGSTPMFPFPELPQNDQPNRDNERSNDLRDVPGLPGAAPGSLGTIVIPSGYARPDISAPLGTPFIFPGIEPLPGPGTFASPATRPRPRPNPTPGVRPQPQPNPGVNPYAPTIPNPAPFPAPRATPAPASPVPRPGVGPTPTLNPSPGPQPTSQAQQCKCSNQKSKQKRKKRKDRTTCYRGTYVETARGLSKSPKEKITCQ